MAKTMPMRPGFTLIELLVYLGMSTIVVVLISTFMVDISHSAARTRSALNLQTNSRLIINRITQAVRTATGPLAYPNASTLVIPVAGGTQTYALTGSSIVETLPTGGSDALNSAETSVIAFLVSDQTIGAGITLTLGPATALTPAVPDYTVTSTIVPRQTLYQ